MHNKQNRRKMVTQCVIELLKVLEDYSSSKPPKFFSTQNFVSDYHFHLRSSSPVMLGFCEVANAHFVVVLAWQVADLQPVKTVVPLSAANQHVGYHATHRSRIRYLSKKNSQMLTNFPKLKKFVKIRTKIR